MPLYLNSVRMAGEVARTPTIRDIGNGKRIANLELVTIEAWTDNTGKQKERRDTHRVAFLGEVHIRTIQSSIRAGDRIYVEGKVQNRKNLDKNGAEIDATEVVVTLPSGALQIIAHAADDALTIPVPPAFRHETFRAAESRAS